MNAHAFYCEIQSPLQGTGQWRRGDAFGRLGIPISRGGGIEFFWCAARRDLTIGRIVATAGLPFLELLRQVPRMLIILEVVVAVRACHCPTVINWGFLRTSRLFIAGSLTDTPSTVQVLPCFPARAFLPKIPWFSY